jgi:DNA (cytosine-5)-methyltransferase 1
MLKAIDLFSGCGGLTTGLKKAKFQVLAGVEIDASATRVFELNHPEVHLWKKDIAGLKGSEIKSTLKLKSGELDLLAGCPPCQGFSRVRTLNGGYVITDDRNELIFEFLRLVRELKPKAVMLENVPGLAEDERIESFNQELESMGYSASYRVLDVADYAVPQRRRRLILLAGKQGPITFAKPARVKKTVRDAIASLPPAGTSGDGPHDIPENRTAKIQRRIAKIPHDGGSRLDLPLRDQLECHKKCNGFKDVYGRMAWDTVAPTLTTGCFNPSKGRFLHPEENRNITMREAALIQTFPKRYKFPADLGKSVLATQIGNALPPEFVRRHAVSVRKHLEANAQNNKVSRKS